MLSSGNSNTHGVPASVISAKIDRQNWTYSLYHPMLLISPSSFSNLSNLAKEHGISDHLESLYSDICTYMGIDHIAVNAPIKDTITPVQDYPQIPATTSDFKVLSIAKPNILRSPVGMMPLYGDFGPSLPWTHAPSSCDLISAFWCSAYQNGIAQVWAPRYTMFSRGNISEKARVLQLDSLRSERLGIAPQCTSAVDLYAGIGYFAFSYAKAGVGKVLCWEINPWSVEGLKRGAIANGWRGNVLQGEEDYAQLFEGDSHFLIFQESNNHAAVRIDSIRDKIPSIKHVNCGYLPSSIDSWEIAAKILDSSGGWIHAHENIAKTRIEMRTTEIVEIFSQLAAKRQDRVRQRHWAVKCEHVERVKSYAPGVIHCVFDIAIFPPGHI
ncbi:S-adenosylmethionine-dependent methyltransferase [Lecanora helva]